MHKEHLITDLEEALLDMPILDTHTHIDAAHPSARGLDDILLYHMVSSELFSAGCPDGERMNEMPSIKESHARLERAIPFVPQIRNTSCYWLVRTILKDLYGWCEPVSDSNWRKLDSLIRERAGKQWGVEILDRARIRRTVTELWRGRDGSCDELFQYSLEWAFFTRCQWGEYDTALYELERTWTQAKPEAPLPVAPGKARPAAPRPIRTLRDVHACLDHYCATTPYERIVSTAQHFSTDIEYVPVSDEEMTKALARRDQAGPAERDIYASYIIEHYFRRLEQRGEPFLFQFSLGADPMPFETASRINQTTLGQLAELIARHPKLNFQCYLASAHANQTLCTFCRELPNLALTGYWWHNFFPPFVRQVIETRLDMLPLNKQIGFFSDAYCIDWAYAKAVMVRKQLAQVLAQKIQQGQYDTDTALGIARDLLFETPRSLCGIRPRTGISE
jgi:glucuronate isomerase